MDTVLPMKIAYLINTYPSPSHSFIRREIAALEAQGVNVQRYALRPANEGSGPDEQRERERTRYVLQSGMIGLIAGTMLAIICQPIRFLHTFNAAARMGFRSASGVAKHLMYLCEACTLLRWFGDEQVNHVHVHFGTNATTVALLCRLLGGPSYSFTAHGPEEFDQPRALCLSEKIEHAAFVVAVCSFGRSQLFRWCGRQQWDKIHIVRCGVDQFFLNTSSQPVETSAHLLQVGRLSEQKGQMLLVDAARKLLDRGIDFQLTLVGDGELRGELQRRIAEQKLEDRVTLAGWKTGSEIRQMMLDSRALVMPSFAEGLPVVLMESLALKRPVDQHVRGRHSGTGEQRYLRLARPCGRCRRAGRCDGCRVVGIAGAIDAIRRRRSRARARAARCSA